MSRSPSEVAADLARTVCEKCGAVAAGCQQKYCGDGRSKDNEHEWILKDSPTATAVVDCEGRTYQECFEREIVFIPAPPITLADKKKRVPAWVITWRYYDRSSNGVVRAYLSKDRADEDLKLLQSDCSSDRVHEIQEMELYE